MLGILNTPEMEELLFKQPVCRIGCCNGETMYIVPISYAYDGQYVYCHTQEGKKIDLMRKNPKVCVEVDQMIDMANWQSLIAWGEFEELTDPATREQALRHLHERILPMVASETVHLSPDWPFVPMELSKITGVTFRIRLTEKTGRFEKADARAVYSA